MAKILLVEDDKSLREIYGVRLQAEGYDIVSAGDGEEALAIAIKERPDLIVSDVMMPKISGFDMLDILRSTTETKDIKVIMMTALSSEDQRARGEALGADRYLVKSQVGIEDVVRTVHDVLGDGVPGATTAPSAPAPAPAPADPLPQPSTPPIAPAPEPLPAPAAPAIDPVMTTPAPMPAPAPIAPEPVMTPNGPAPAVPSPSIDDLSPQLGNPAADPVTPPVVNMPPSPAPAPAEPVTQPVAPAPQPAVLPEPTAPFSSPRPASLGDRVINPITPDLSTAAPLDIAAQMNQELAAALPPAPTAPVAGAAPVPAPAPTPTPDMQAPMPEQPSTELPPLPPQPPTAPAAPTQTV